MEKRSGIITFQGNPLTLMGPEIKKGDKAPDFTALKTDMSPVKLSDFSGKTRILSIMPSVDTPVCAAQTRRFNMEASKLDNVQIITLSVDLPFALSRFCAAEGIENAITLSDHAALDFGQKYGFAIEELRLLSRGVVIIDKNDTVQYLEYVKEVTDEPDYDQALNIVREL